MFMRMGSTVPPCPGSKPYNSMSTTRVLQAVLLYVRRAAVWLSVSQLQEFSTRLSNLCLNGNTVHRPGVSKRPLPRSLSYSNEWFLKNEAACTLAFQKYAPRKFLVVLVMKREVDNPIIVVVTVEGVKAVNPGYKDVNTVTFLVTAPEAANARNCERNTQETPLTSGFHATTDGQLPTAAKAGPRGPGLYGPSLGAF